MFTEQFFDLLSDFGVDWKVKGVENNPENCEGRVLDFEKHRTLESCEKLFNKALTAKQFEKVKKVSMDMWKQFIGTAEVKLPNAEINCQRLSEI